MPITLYPNLILDALRRVRYPGTGQDLVTAGMVEDDIRIEGIAYLRQAQLPLHQVGRQGR